MLLRKVNSSTWHTIYCYMRSLTQRKKFPPPSPRKKMWVGEVKNTWSFDCIEEGLEVKILANYLLLGVLCLGIYDLELFHFM